MRGFKIIVLGFIVLSTSLLAQPFTPSPEGGPGFKSQLREKISIIRMWKLIDVLELDRVKVIAGPLGVGVGSRCTRSVGSGYFRSVQIGHITVVVLHS